MADDTLRLEIARYKRPDPMGNPSLDDMYFLGTNLRLRLEMDYMSWFSDVPGNGDSNFGVEICPMFFETMTNPDFHLQPGDGPVVISTLDMPLKLTAIELPNGAEEVPW